MLAALTEMGLFLLQVKTQYGIEDNWVHIFLFRNG